MKPIFTSPFFQTYVGDIIGRLVFSSVTLAARYWNWAPVKSLPNSKQPSTGWQPPYAMRRSSVLPSSNSWLPTLDTSRPSLFSASMLGSSWKSPDSIGLPPIMSPAAAVTEYS